MYKGFSKGYWHVGEEKRIAVDYDVGDEDLTKLALRALDYRREFYLTQVWGAPTRERRDELEKMIKLVVPSVQVLYAPYTSGQTFEVIPSEEEREKIRQRQAVEIEALSARLKSE